MINVYSNNQTFLTTLTAYKDLKVEEDLDKGYKTLSFSVSYQTILLHEEEKLVYDNYLYIIKEIKMNNNNLYEVYANPYFGDLYQIETNNFFSANQSLAQLLNLLLIDSTWTYKLHNNFLGSYDLQINNMRLFDAILLVKKIYQMDIFFDTKNRCIHFWQIRGSQSPKELIIDITNLADCKIEAHTYDLINRLVPIGKDNIDISMVNGGQRYLEDLTYSKDIVLGYYIDSSINSPIDLLTIGKKKLEEVSRPSLTYSIKLTKIPYYLEVGDQVRIIDKIKQIDTVQRVQKLTIYPHHPEKSKIEIGSPLPNFTKIYKEFQSAQAYMNNSTMLSLSTLGTNVYNMTNR